MEYLERLAEVMSKIESETETVHLDENIIQENHYFRLEESDYLWFIEQSERVPELIAENTEIRKGYQERSKRVRELEDASDKVYVLMWFNEISENTFYTNEDEVSERVEKLNKILNAGYWYKTLTKVAS